MILMTWYIVQSGGSWLLADAEESDCSDYLNAYCSGIASLNGESHQDSEALEVARNALHRGHPVKIQVAEEPDNIVGKDANLQFS